MIRVVRILEYTYQTNEQAEVDMSNWYIPANGAKELGKGKTIKSATMINLWEGIDEADNHNV